mgnify:FL=1
MDCLSILNFVIAALALLVAAYSICYTRRFNRRKLIVQNGSAISDPAGCSIHRFELGNISPSPITVVDIKFSDPSGNRILPFRHEPTRTCTISGPFNREVDDFIEPDRFEYHLKTPFVLNPYESEEFGYYFDLFYEEINIVVTCAERIHRFRKRQSFVVHFDQDDE